MSDSGAYYILTLEIEQRKLSTNSNGHKLSHGCPIQAHIISRRLKLNNKCSREIQMVLTFQTEVRFRRIIYRDAWNWTTKALQNSNGHILSHGGPIEAHNISRNLKLNHKCSRESQMVINCHTEVRFRRILYLDARNWKMKLWEKSNDNNFLLECPIESHNISRRS